MRVTRSGIEVLPLVKAMQAKGRSRSSDAEAR